MFRCRVTMVTTGMSMNVEFEAPDHDAAVKKAGELIDDSYPPKAIVMQVKVKTLDGWSCVFDYMNGMCY